jgi:hypothetical protein
VELSERIAQVIFGHCLSPVGVHSSSFRQL